MAAATAATAVYYSDNINNNYFNILASVALNGDPAGGSLGTTSRWLRRALWMEAFGV